MSELLLPFQLPFMQTAFLVAVLVAVPTALLSCFLVLKGWSLMGDAVSHAVLPGIVGAFILGLPMAVGAFAGGMACALLTGFVQENSRVKQDTVMGVVFSGLFALGLVMFHWAETDLHLDQILFGDMLGVYPEDLRLSALACGVVVIMIALFWRDLLLEAFDPAQARAIGLRTGLLHYGLLALLALSVVGALKAVGIILTVSLLIAPGATAFLLVRRFGAMLIVAVLISVLASVSGVYASFYGTAPGPTIVVILTGGFVLAFVVTRIRGGNFSDEKLEDGDGV